MYMLKENYPHNNNISEHVPQDITDILVPKLLKIAKARREIRRSNWLLHPSTAYAAEAAIYVSKPSILHSLPRRSDVICVQQLSRALRRAIAVGEVCVQAYGKMVYCQAFGCRNRSDKHREKSFHHIPNPKKKPELCKRWLIAIKTTKFDLKTYVFSRNNVNNKQINNGVNAAFTARAYRYGL